MIQFANGPINILSVDTYNLISNDNKTITKVTINIEAIYSSKIVKIIGFIETNNNNGVRTIHGEDLNKLKTTIEAIDYDLDKLIGKFKNVKYGYSTDNTLIPIEILDLTVPNRNKR